MERRDVWRIFWNFIRTFWTGFVRKKAWILTIGLGTGLILVLLTNFSVNRWQSALFDALEKKDSARTYTVLLFLPLLVVMGALAGAIVVYARETLQVHWREWVVARLSDSWLSRKRYHTLQIHGIEPANPEYRIADDVRVSLDPLVDFAVGWFSAILAALTFIGVLWSVGGGWTIKWQDGGTFTLPAFMVLAALLYGSLLTILTWFIGRPLVGAVARRNEAEARLRFELTKVREHAALLAARDEGGAARLSIADTYRSVVASSLLMIRYHVRLTWITNGSGILVPIFATALAVPKYLAGEMSLGALVSLGPAFQQVQLAMAWLVDNFRQLALWYASAGRVVDLITTIEAITAHEAQLQNPDVSAETLKSAVDA
jgi:vitamin B12/bleomycin/antimicrobial peptide transport system ATP-binding/permease protein